MLHKNDVACELFNKVVFSEDNVIYFQDEEGNATAATLEEISQIEAAYSEKQADYDSKQYARDRAEAYPPLEDQLDDIFHNGLEGWKESIQAVKDQYPKG